MDESFGVISALRKTDPTEANLTGKFPKLLEESLHILQVRERSLYYPIYEILNGYLPIVLT